jgi:hypothetical protein
MVPGREYVYYAHHGGRKDNTMVVCRHWARDGRCPLGDACKFFHGSEEDAPAAAPARPAASSSTTASSASSSLVPVTPFKSIWHIHMGLAAGTPTLNDRTYTWALQKLRMLPPALRARLRSCFLFCLPILPPPYTRTHAPTYAPTHPHIHAPTHAYGARTRTNTHCGGTHAEVWRGSREIRQHAIPDRVSAAALVSGAQTPSPVLKANHRKQERGAPEVGGSWEATRERNRVLREEEEEEVLLTAYNK